MEATKSPQSADVEIITLLTFHVIPNFIVIGQPNFCSQIGLVLKFTSNCQVAVPLSG